MSKTIPTTQTLHQNEALHNSTLPQNYYSFCLKALVASYNDQYVLLWSLDTASITTHKILTYCIWVLKRKGIRANYAINLHK